MAAHIHLEAAVREARRGMEVEVEVVLLRPVWLCQLQRRRQVLVTGGGEELGASSHQLLRERWTPSSRRTCRSCRQPRSDCHVVTAYGCRAHQVARSRSGNATLTLSSSTAGCDEIGLGKVRAGDACADWRPFERQGEGAATRAL